MSSRQDPWFVVERSEALAGLLLTSRKDVRIRNEDRSDDGIDLLVEVNPGETRSTRFFMVQVKGTISSKAGDWIDDVKELCDFGQDWISLPTCVFILNVRDNRSSFAWVAEPLIEAEQAKLRFPQPGEFHDLDRAAVDSIVEQVLVWYDALSRQLQPT